MATNLLQIQNATKSYGARSLFLDAQFAVNEGEHVGVIGPNGAGKTTLFKVLIGQDEFDSGTVVRARHLKVGYLSQHDEWPAEQTIEDYLQDCVRPLWELKSQGRELGLEDDMWARPIRSFSGGYRMRCKLLYLLGQEPNLMLLDEPTNYLDLETTLVLERFLQGFEGAFLLISHDREFLRRTTDHVLEIEQGEMTKFNGNLDDYFEQKQMLRDQLEARAYSLADKRETILDFVRRFGAKATKAKQAQSRLKSLQRMEMIEMKPLPVTARIQIPPPERAAKLVAELKSVNLGYGTSAVLHQVNLRIQSGEHVAVVGLNGAGKSTLLKALAGSLDPQSGLIERGGHLTIGYFAQHVAESLNMEQTVLESMASAAHPSLTQQHVLNMAGSLLFSGDDVQKRVRILSGGERSRVALGQILLKKVNCLILDEPTNHLDFQTVEALTQALSEFEGTVVLVSHDRSFTRRVGTKILEIDHGRVTTYLGTYDEYVWSVQNGALATRSAEAAATSRATNENKSAPATAPTSAPMVSVNYKEQKKALDRQLKQLEKLSAQSEVTMAELNQNLHQLNEKLVAANAAELPELARALGETQLKLNQIEETWLEANEKKLMVQMEIRKLAEST